MKIYVYLMLCLPVATRAQVGIGTTSPSQKAALHIQSTTQGVIFPRLSTAQRDAISNPPNGLHVFNTDERCLNYYDSLFQIWNCYCENDTCKKITITLPKACGINFQTAYASKYPGVTRFYLVVNAGDTISGCGPALDFSTVTALLTIRIINRGVILGQGGSGGAGATGNSGSCIRPAVAGTIGGNAITTNFSANIHIENYGAIVAGGGGGGGGGTTGANVYGGGGGAGAGLANAQGGAGGGTTFSGPFGSCGTITVIAQNGTGGTATGAGTGGTGANGGGNGGNGGLPGQAGLNGTGANAGIGGVAGKAIGGGSGNSITSYGSGIVTGAVD